MEVSLSKALKIKNRIIKEVSDLQNIIINNNSRIVGNVEEFDVEKSYDELNKLIDNLVDIKIKINTSNNGIISKMVQISELKSHISFLSKIDTSNGNVSNSRYDSVMVEKVSTFSASDIRSRSKAYQKNINKIQDEIDRYNATTMIEISYEE